MDNSGGIAMAFITIVSMLGEVRFCQEDSATSEFYKLSEPDKGIVRWILGLPEEEFEASWDFDDYTVSVCSKGDSAKPLYVFCLERLRREA